MALNRREKALAAIAAGVEIKSSDGKQRHRIADAAAQYLSFVKENHSHKTWLAYSRNIKSFQDSCAKTFLDQIDRADVLEFITACRKPGLATDWRACGRQDSPQHLPKREHVFPTKSVAAGYT